VAVVNNFILEATTKDLLKLVLYRDLFLLMENILMPTRVSFGLYFCNIAFMPSSNFPSLGVDHVFSKHKMQENTKTIIKK
jgi:hypothetical protein